MYNICTGWTQRTHKAKQSNCDVDIVRISTCGGKSCSYRKALERRKGPLNIV